MTVLERLEAWKTKGRQAFITIDDGLGASAAWEVELQEGPRKVYACSNLDGDWLSLEDTILVALKRWDET